ncbi:MAG: Uma2 family endonuclease [Acidobacteria bacterium]|nr:Uma2 family endonuclease [Acidobacteriota bacterium]
MSTQTLVSVAEYLSTSFRPDREYLDGVVLERAMGERDHSRLQSLLCAFLIQQEREWGIDAVVEQRVQVKQHRFRIPDISVLAHGAKPEPIYTEPPFLCIEILSKDDAMSSMLERIHDYLEFGVAYVWVIDPRTRRAWTYTRNEIREVTDGTLRTQNPDIAVPFAAIFEAQ